MADLAVRQFVHDHCRTALQQALKLSSNGPVIAFLERPEDPLMGSWIMESLRQLLDENRIATIDLDLDRLHSRNEVDHSLRPFAESPERAPALAPKPLRRSRLDTLLGRSSPNPPSAGRGALSNAGPLRLAPIEHPAALLLSAREVPEAPVGRRCVEAVSVFTSTAERLVFVVSTIANGFLGDLRFPEATHISVPAPAPHREVVESFSRHALAQSLLPRQVQADAETWARVLASLFGTSFSRVENFVHRSAFTLTRSVGEPANAGYNWPQVFFLSLLQERFPDFTDFLVRHPSGAGSVLVGFQRWFLKGEGRGPIAEDADDKESMFLQDPELWDLFEKLLGTSDGGSSRTTVQPFADHEQALNQLIGAGLVSAQRAESSQMHWKEIAKRLRETRPWNRGGLTEIYRSLRPLPAEGRRIGELLLAAVERQNTGEYDAAAALIRRAKTTAHSEGFREQEYDCLMLAAQNERLNAAYEWKREKSCKQALEYLKEAADIAEGWRGAQQIARAFIQRGQVLRDMGNYGDAEKLWDTAVKRATQMRDQEAMLLAEDARGRALWSLAHSPETAPAIASEQRREGEKLETKAIEGLNRAKDLAKKLHQTDRIREIEKVLKSIGPLAFVSYSHDDADLAALVRDRLTQIEERTSLSFFIDERIQEGDDWLSQIGESIDDAELFIILASPSFLDESRFSRFETLRMNESMRRRGKDNEPLILWIQAKPIEWSDVDRTFFADFHAVEPDRNLENEEDRPEILDTLSDRIDQFLEEKGFGSKQESESASE